MHNIHEEDAVLRRRPVLRPADVYRDGIDHDDTLEEPIVVEDASTSPYDATYDMSAEEFAQEDGILVAIGAGLVTSMLALLMMLVSGYGAV